MGIIIDLPHSDGHYKDKTRKCSLAFHEVLGSEKALKILVIGIMNFGFYFVLYKPKKRMRMKNDRF